MLISATAIASFMAYVTALWLTMRRPGRQENAVWTAAFGLMVVHVVLAFHLAHNWSHRAAYDETARQTEEMFGWKWGGGVFANYALLAVWAIEVVQWWRGRSIKAIRVFLAFMWFNGIVVFGHGWSRWIGVAGFLVLAVTWWRTKTEFKRGPRE